MKTQEDSEASYKGQSELRHDRLVSDGDSDHPREVDVDEQRTVENGCTFSAEAPGHYYIYHDRVRSKMTSYLWPTYRVDRARGPGQIE